MDGRGRRGMGSVGPALALTAGALWSLGAIFARLADNSDAFQYLVWRSIGIIAVIELTAVLRGHPQPTKRAFTSGRRMVAGNLTLLLASIGFVYAVKTTSAANAAFLGSTSPLFGAATARIFLGERINSRTIVTIAVAFVGLVIMVVSDLGAGSLVGNAAALASALGFALYTAIVRSAPHRDWSPVLPGYGVIMIVICAAVTFANGRPIVPPTGDVVLALVHGGVFIVGGTLLYNVASRSVEAATMTVFAQTEMVLVPIWALLFLAERPKPTTFVGGAIILLAVIAKALSDSRSTRLSKPPVDAAARVVDAR